MESCNAADSGAVFAVGHSTPRQACGRPAPPAPLTSGKGSPIEWVDGRRLKIFFKRCSRDCHHPPKQCSAWQ